MKSNGFPVLRVVGIGAVDPGGAVGVWLPPAAADAVESSAAPAATSQIERNDAVTFEPGERNLQSVVTDGVFAYPGTRTSPGQVVKMRCSDLVRVDSVDLDPGAGEPVAGSSPASDPLAVVTLGAGHPRHSLMMLIPGSSSLR